jgi:hypothetical protein
MATKPVEVRNVATGALVVSGATNTDGRWEFDLADETQAYRVEIGAGAGSPQKVTQAPASIELEYLFVRYASTFKGPVALPPGTTIGGITIDPDAPPGTGALDPRYVQKVGDTMTGDLVIQKSNAGLHLRAPAAPVDNKRLVIHVSDADGRLRIAAQNDAGVGGANVIDITRTGNNLTRLAMNNVVISTNAKTNVFGTNGGAAATSVVAYTDANILLYGDFANNWAGFGADAGGNVWLRTGLSGALVPVVYFAAGTGEIVVQRGALYATKGLFVYHPSDAAQGIAYFGNTAAHHLSWTGAAFNLTDGMVISSAGSVNLNLVDGSVGFSTVLMRNSTNATVQWRHGVQGSSGSVSPANSLAWYNDSYGCHMYMQPDGRIAMGAPPPAGTTAQLDIRTIHPTVPVLRVNAHSGHGLSGNIFQVMNYQGIFTFGVSSEAVLIGGPLYIARGAGAYAGRAIPVRDTVGTLLGYLQLYS